MRKLIVLSVLTLASVPALAQQVWQQPKGQAMQVPLTPETQAHDKIVDALTARVNELRREDAAER
jgi:hypothetical protein